MQQLLHILLLLLLVFLTTNAFSLQNARVRSSISMKSFAMRSMLRPFPRQGLAMSSEDQPNSVATTNSDQFDLGAWFNPSTRGGVIVWCVILTLIPVGFYQYFVSTGVDSEKVGAYVGAIFVLLSNLLWASSYIFRVANKDMTYAKQLRDYENAVLQKRLEELKDEEIDALMQEIESEDEKTK